MGMLHVSGTEVQIVNGIIFNKFIFQIELYWVLRKKYDDIFTNANDMEGDNFLEDYQATIAENMCLYGTQNSNNSIRKYHWKFDDYFDGKVFHSRELSCAIFSSHSLSSTIC